MRFQLKNFGSLREVDLEIPGLTVLSGENGTGKRTLCRAFFTLVDSLGGCNAKPTGTQREAVYEAVEDFYLKWQDVENQSEFELRGIDRRLEWAALHGGRKAVSEELYEWMDNCGMGYSEEELAVLDQYVTGVFQGTTMLPEAIDIVFRETFAALIPGRNNAIKPVTLQLTQQRKKTEVRFSAEGTVLKNAEKREGQPLFLEAKLGTALDLSLRYSAALAYFPERIRCVIRQLENPLERAPAVDGDLRRCLDAWQNFCGGTLFAQYQRLFFKVKSDEQEMSPSMLSDGFKVPVILQALAADGVVPEGGTVIWEEPESHLHPKQQVKLAELIVRLQKPLKLHVLLTTNSPYLVSALDVYSRKYGVTDTNRWYIAERTEDGCVVRHVTGRQCEIYDSLAQPYQTIEDEAMRCGGINGTASRENHEATLSKL